MIILYLILVVEVAKYQIFNYYASHVIEVNQIVVFVRFITEQLELIVVMDRKQRNQRLLLHNVQEQPRKEQDVKTEQQIVAVVVIYTNI
jgi:hypothetical protein